MRSICGAFVLSIFLAFGAVPASAEGKLVASNYSDRYHQPDCKIVAKIGKDERVTFDTPEQAAAAGLAPCKKCHPHATEMNFGKREK